LSARARIEKLLEATRARQQTPDEDRRRLERVEQRLEHLETMVEGLQDAIHRDSIRHEERMSELERKTEPEAVAKALSEDARRRGL
jgi:predicted  nucleic acid-binding Zn-ribbon protein